MIFMLAGLFCFSLPVSADVIINAQPETTQEETTEEETTEESTTETVKNGWSKDKKYYYVDGKKVKGVYKVDDSLYYFDKSGKWYAKKGMCKVHGATYYFNKDHSLKTGIVKVKKKAYYFQKDGKRFEGTGVQKVEGKYYYFSAKHELKTGWKRDSKEKRYYFHKKKYYALTGWNYVGKYKYYFKKNGQLVQDVRKKLSSKQKKSYIIKVNRTASCVTVYAKDGLKGYTIPVVAFVCSAGNGTPTGTFKIRDKLRWHELMGPCWGQWCEHLTDDILFHSVYYDRQNDKYSLNVNAYNKLGTMASHGCVRLTAGDAKWIYDNCKIGTKVTIYNNAKNPGPFDKPKAKKLSASHTWDPTDPTIKK